LEMQLVGRPLIREPCNDRIQVTMLTPQSMQLTKKRIPIAQHISQPTIEDIDPTSGKKLHLVRWLATALQYLVVATLLVTASQPVLNGGMKLMSLNTRLDALKERHASLESRIFEEDQRPSPDTQTLTRLKLEKLRLKEEMERLRASCS